MTFKEFRNCRFRPRSRNIMIPVFKISLSFSLGITACVSCLVPHGAGYGRLGRNKLSQSAHAAVVRFFSFVFSVFFFTVTVVDLFYFLYYTICFLILFKSFCLIVNRCTYMIKNNWFIYEYISRIDCRN